MLRRGSQNITNIFAKRITLYFEEIKGINNPSNLNTADNVRLKRKLQLPHILLKLEEKNRKIFFKIFIRYLRYTRKSVPGLDYESFVINRMSESIRKRQSPGISASGEQFSEGPNNLKDIRSLNSCLSESEYYAPSVRLTYDSPGIKFSPFSKISLSKEARESLGFDIGSLNSSHSISKQEKAK